MSKAISLLTPTFNRRQFLDLMILNVSTQSYPKNLIEWVILDSYGRNGEISQPMLNNDEIAKIKTIIPHIGINYKFVPKPLDIGEKRNMLVKMARNNICINMDSDDIYFQDYVTNIVNELEKPNIQICGSPEMLFVYPLHDFKMSFIRCEAYRQIHEGCMGFTKKHFRRMGGFAKTGTGEGAGLFDNCIERYFSKMPINDLMCCVAHDTNTCDKNKFINNQIEARIEGGHRDILERIFITSRRPNQEQKQQEESEVLEE